MEQASPLIPFHQPFLGGSELDYVRESIASRSWQGDGSFSKKCSSLLQTLTGARCLLTPSGTHALELGMKVFDFEPGSEVILPSFTFPSTANAVINAGLKPVFAEIRRDVRVSERGAEPRRMRRVCKLAVRPDAQAFLLDTAPNAFEHAGRECA